MKQTEQRSLLTESIRTEERLETSYKATCQLPAIITVESGLEHA